MKREQLIALARKLGVSEQYYTSPTKRLIWAIQEAEGLDPGIIDNTHDPAAQQRKWGKKK